jgi:NtrC-family two-component system sensor histidine kinase KinB
MFTTLRAKLFAGFLLILLLLLALGGYSIFSFRSLEEITSSGLDQNSESILADLSMYESIVRMNATQLRMLAGESSGAHAVFEEETSLFYAALERARRSAEQSEPELRLRVERGLDSLDYAWTDYRTHLPVFEDLVKHDPSRARALYNSTLSPEFDNLKNIDLELSSLNVLAFRTSKSTVISRARNATFGVLMVTLIALILGAIGSFVIARRTTKPLRALTDSLKSLEAGHLDARITVESADEIGDLAFEFNRLAERLRVFEALNVNEIVREKQKSEAIIESIDDPLLLFDADGQLTLMNRAAEDVTGLTEQTAQGS